MSKSRNTKAKPFRAVPGRKTGVKKNQDKTLILRPAYSGQYCTTMNVVGDPIVLSTTVTTGLIAQVYPVTNAAVNNFATRFAAFEEYRIIKVNFIVNNFSSINPGLGSMWIDESSVAAPTAVEAQQRLGVKYFSFADVGKRHALTYVPHSPAEQIWNPIATSQTLAYFKTFSNNADFGSSIVATQYCEVRATFVIQLRGFN